VTDDNDGGAPKTIVITGASSGIGLESAVGLARGGARVVMACRNPTKGAAARDDVIARSGSDRVELMALDLASFASIRGFAKEALDRFDHIDVLLNNAGAVSMQRVETTDGFEQTFGVNHLGHFLLTSLLRDRLVATPGARVVTVASDAHRFCVGGLRFDDLQATKGRYHPFGAYSRSKLANILFTRELARRLDGTGVTANCVHPGFVASNFGRQGAVGVIAMTLGRPFAIDSEKGARTSIFVASDSSLDGITGHYWYKCAMSEPTARAQDDATAARLWDVSEELIASKG
jgi:NAD(P)-dependent dehydrogenase (short-subunit alcohol dehydrogenase family)